MPPAKLTGPCVLEGHGPCRTGSRAFRRLTTFAFHKIHPAVREQHPGVALDAVLCHGHYMRFVEAGRGGNSRPYWERERTRILEEQWRHVGASGKPTVCSGSASSRDGHRGVSPLPSDPRPYLQPSHKRMTSPAPELCDANAAVLVKHHISASPERFVPFGTFANDVEMRGINVTYGVDKPSYCPWDALHSNKTPVPAGTSRQDHVTLDFARRPRGRPRTAINTFGHRGFDPQLFVHERNDGADVGRGNKQEWSGADTKTTSFRGRKGTDRARTKRDLQWAGSVPSELSATRQPEPAASSGVREDRYVALLRAAHCGRPSQGARRQPTAVPNCGPSAPAQNHKSGVASAPSDEGASPAVRSPAEVHRRFGLDVEDNVNSALLLMFLASRARRGEPRAAADASTGCGPRKALDCTNDDDDDDSDDDAPRRGDRETGETEYGRRPRGRQQQRRQGPPAVTAYFSPPATCAARAHHQACRAATSLPSIREIFPGFHEWGVLKRPPGLLEIENSAKFRLRDLHGCTGEDGLFFAQ